MISISLSEFSSNTNLKLLAYWGAENIWCVFKSSGAMWKKPEGKRFLLISQSGRFASSFLQYQHVWCSTCCIWSQVGILWSVYSVRLFYDIAAFITICSSGHVTTNKVFSCHIPLQKKKRSPINGLECNSFVQKKIIWFIFSYTLHLTWDDRGERKLESCPLNQKYSHCSSSIDDEFLLDHDEDKGFYLKSASI